MSVLNMDLIDSIHCGDSAFILKQIPSNSVDLIITSPPYYLQRTYNDSGMSVGNEKTVESYIDSLLEVFEEAIRVIKPSGSIVYNLGDKYLSKSLLLVPYRFAIEVTQRYNIRLVNDITWVKTNPSPRQFKRRLVSSTEPFFHFVKTDEYYYNRDKFFDKEKPQKTYKPSKKLGDRYRCLIKSSTLKSDEKLNAIKALDDAISEVHQEKIEGFRMKIRGIHAEAFGGQPGGRKAQMERQGFNIIKLNGRSIKRDSFQIPVESVPMLNHCAIYPLQIIREFVKLLSPKSGIVLDPYIGSGTTAIASLKEGCHYIGIDIDPDYCDIAKKRISEC